VEGVKKTSQRSKEVGKGKQKGKLGGGGLCKKEGYEPVAQGDVLKRKHALVHIMPERNLKGEGGAMKGEFRSQVPGSGTNEAKKGKDLQKNTSRMGEPFQGGHGQFQKGEVLLPLC